MQSLAYRFIFALALVAFTVKGQQQFPDSLGFGAGADSNLASNLGADPRRDTFHIKISAKMVTFSTRLLSKASQFLGEQDASEEDFRDWYDNTLEKFQLKQEDINYSSPSQKAKDLRAFTRRLDAIAAEFAEKQGIRSNRFSQKAAQQSWGKLSKQMQKIVNQLHRLGLTLNDIQVQRSDIYYNLGETAGVQDDGKLVNIKALASSPNTWTYDGDGPFGPWEEDSYPGAPDSNSKLKVLYGKMYDAVTDWNEPGISLRTKQSIERSLLKMRNTWADLVKKWNKLYTDAKRLDSKEAQTKTNIDTLKAQLATWDEQGFLGHNGLPSTLVDSDRFED